MEIADKHVRAVKRRAWMLDAAEFEAALAAARAQRQAIKQVDDDYEARKLRPEGARMSWGGYRVRGDFHFVWSIKPVSARTVMKAGSATTVGRSRTSSTTSLSATGAAIGGRAGRTAL